MMIFFCSMVSVSHVFVFLSLVFLFCSAPFFETVICPLSKLYTIAFFTSPAHFIFLGGEECKPDGLSHLVCTCLYAYIHLRLAHSFFTSYLSEQPSNILNSVL